MRPIKFRGKARDGQYYCGDLIHVHSVPTIRMREDSNTYYIDVYPETVAQLVGYDADNAEVYEGDVLIDGEGHEYIATLDSMLLWTKDPNLKYWHLTFNQSDDEDLPTSSNKMLWDFYKNCCEKMAHTDFLRLKKE